MITNVTIQGFRHSPIRQCIQQKLTTGRNPSPSQSGRSTNIISRIWLKNLKSIIIYSNCQRILSSSNNKICKKLVVLFYRRRFKAYLHLLCPSPSLSPCPSILHCVYGNGPFDGQNGSRTHSVRQSAHLHWHNDKLWRTRWRRRRRTQ